jgi:hypothetical protein
MKNETITNLFAGKIMVFEDSYLWSKGNIRKNDYKLYLADVKEKINLYFKDAEFLNYHVFNNYDDTQNIFIIFNKKQNDTNKTKKT